MPMFMNRVTKYIVAYTQNEITVCCNENEIGLT